MFGQTKSHINTDPGKGLLLPHSTDGNLTLALGTQVSQFLKVEQAETHEEKLYPQKVTQSQDSHIPL